MSRICTRLTAATARLEWNRIENNARNTLLDDDNYCKCSSEQRCTDCRDESAPRRSTYEHHSTEFVFKTDAFTSTTSTTITTSGGLV